MTAARELPLWFIAAVICTGTIYVYSTTFPFQIDSLTGFFFLFEVHWDFWWFIVIVAFAHLGTWTRGILVAFLPNSLKVLGRFSIQVIRPELWSILGPIRSGFFPRLERLFAVLTTDCCNFILFFFWSILQSLELSFSRKIIDGVGERGRGNGLRPLSFPPLRFSAVAAVCRFAFQWLTFHRHRWNESVISSLLLFHSVDSWNFLPRNNLKNQTKQERKKSDVFFLFFFCFFLLLEQLGNWMFIQTASKLRMAIVFCFFFHSPISLSWILKEASKLWKNPSVNARKSLERSPSKPPKNVKKNIQQHRSCEGITKILQRIIKRDVKVIKESAITSKIVH